MKESGAQEVTGPNLMLDQSISVSDPHQSDWSLRMRSVRLKFPLWVSPTRVSVRSWGPQRSDSERSVKLWLQTEVFDVSPKWSDTILSIRSVGFQSP